MHDRRQRPPCSHRTVRNQTAKLATAGAEILGRTANAGRMSTHIALQAFRNLFRSRAESIRCLEFLGFGTRSGRWPATRAVLSRSSPTITGCLRRNWPQPSRASAPSGDDLAGLRGRALLLVGFAGALRRAELAAIYVEHIEPRLRRAPEPAPHGSGVTVAIPLGATKLCPIYWQDAAGTTAGGCWTAAVEPTTLKHLGRNKGCAISMNVWSSVTSSIVTHSAGSVATSRTTAPPNCEGPSEIAKNDRQ